MFRVAWLAVILAASAGAARAAEEWHVVKGEGGAWAYNKGGAIKSELTGETFARLARYHVSPQVDGAVTFVFEVRTFRAACAKGQVQQIANERFAKSGAPVAAALQPAPPVWESVASGWPKMVKQFVCDGTGLADAVKVPSKLSALVTMETLAAQAGASAVAKPVAVASTAKPSIQDEKFCKDLRAVMGLGGQDSPAFSSLYLNAAEKSKYAGLGATTIDGFDVCKIERSAFRPMEPRKYFGSYYCKKSGLSEAKAAAFAADTSKRVAACLQWPYATTSDEGGSAVKSYIHTQEMTGLPRVRLVHERDHSVMIHLDSNGR